MLSKYCLIEKQMLTQVKKENRMVNKEKGTSRPWKRNFENFDKYKAEKLTGIDIFLHVQSI